MNKKKTLHLIGNAHLDPVWQWRWQEGYRAVVATFLSALDRMDEEPEFIFTSSQAGVYEWIERSNPALLKRIKKRVKEGRWRIMGGWWVQTDCNIPSGESFARQGLYGQQYLLKTFGITSKVGYNVDSFGHNGMLPQILKKCGMDTYVFMRPGNKENTEIPGRLFTWQSADGSQVKTYQIPVEYAVWGENLERNIRWVAEELPGYPALMVFYGVGNHGGGPTKDNIERINRLKKDKELPALVYSAPDIFFDSDAVKSARLPVFKKELQRHAPGCYSVHSGIKKANRALENLLEQAEKFSVMASSTSGMPYPADEIRKAWHGVLFNQFHDILAGTSVKQAYEDARDLHGASSHIASESLTFALGAISSKVDTRGEGIALIAFNPSSWGRSEFCEFELHRPHFEVEVLDDMGNVVPSQLIGNHVCHTTNDLRPHVCFKADVGSLGYRLYRAVPKAADTVKSAVKATKTTLENEYLRIKLSAASGQIASIYDKKRSVEMLAGKCKARVIKDETDTWGHGALSWHNEVGKFGNAELSVTENGPVRAAVRAVSRYKDSTLVQTYRIYAGSDFVECVCEVDWHEKLRMMKLEFPTSIETGSAAFEIPYGHVERETNGEEVPGQSWIDVSDGRSGLCLLNDAKYSYDVQGGKVNLTVLRSPVYVHHDPCELEAERLYEYIDQGRQSFTLRLIPHSGSWQNAFPHKRAAELNQPLIVHSLSPHKGGAPCCGSFLSVGAANVIVSAIKQSEDKAGIVVRAFETNGRKTSCSFRLGKTAWEAEFGPCEIKTFLISDKKVTETDILERSI